MDVQIPNSPHQLKNYLAGSWEDGAGAELSVKSPYTGGLIGVGKLATAKQIDAAAEVASEAQKAWANTPLKERTRVMFNLRNVLLENQDELSHLKSSESGKTFAEGKAGLMKGIEVLE